MRARRALALPPLIVVAAAVAVIAGGLVLAWGASQGVESLGSGLGEGLDEGVRKFLTYAGFGVFVALLLWGIAQLGRR